MAVQLYLAGLLLLFVTVKGDAEGAALDGGYSNWSEFSECSATCGDGLRIRKRSCNNPEPKNGGKDCESLGPDTDTKACNSFPCPVNGGYSQWSNFTECSISCGGGGIQSRSRQCNNPLPCCGGMNCGHLGPSTETRACGECACDIDGGWSEWCAFTRCTVSCGGGVRIRNKTCTNPTPSGLGLDCTGPAAELQICNTESCHNANYTQWTGWSECSVTCGVGEQKRSRTCTNPPPQPGRKNCEEEHLGPADETQKCRLKPCPIDGNYTEWTEWSVCSASCGGGSQLRTRQCTRPLPKYGGVDCDELGPANQTQECNPDPCPIDGNYTEWSEWSECDVNCGGGVQSRSRTCTNPSPKNGGNNCEGLGPTNDTQACNPDPCSIDGNYTEWSEWPECSATCGGGLQNRTRNCTNPPPQYGGKECEGLGPAVETQSCGSEKCPMDGNYTKWSDWSKCSVTCGGGEQSRSRTCTNPPPKYGGKNCQGLGSANDTQECNPDPCPIDGNYTEWSEWSVCSTTCGGGFQTRTRNCTNPPPQNDGRDCEGLGLATETKSCGSEKCPTDGNYTTWSDWSECSTTCGEGKQSRSRTCTSPPPKHSGKNCSELGAADDTQMCNPGPCPIDGNYSQWTEWSDCDVTCGRGVQNRSRSCTSPPPQYDGKSCEGLGPANETKECNKNPCPIDGDYTEWSKWSKCSVTCGRGSKTRTRECTNPPPQYGGKDCSDLGPVNDTQGCNTTACPPPCSAGLDVAIVLDKSKSVKIANLHKVIDSLVELVDKFEPAPDKDHFGLITFNSKAHVEFTFADEARFSKQQLMEKIKEIPRTLEFQTRTDLAMKAARDQLFSPSGGNRPEKPNVMIVFTDGKPTKQPRNFKIFTTEFYQDPKVADLYTVAVGIGNGINIETLHDIAGPNGNVIAVESFDRLEAELSEIKDKVCE
ncbi:A disintegrin and metalloproteinase with thrombospondin motifs adt-1-like [Stylophora pistillata]|uniref:A disintegrin and metalloproteinase with thrombospondin motifs adt-1-like n=1 Tax=Stylophora pistillata TaxID=50429 RepID=UPI000C04646E|nr:A disintegrin and metalloproteinase with thrombospondin motifs adt-1-like [Stylophora pistillata]